VTAVIATPDTFDGSLSQGFTVVPATAAGPWDTRRRAARIAVRDQTAVVELATAVGSVKRGDNPLNATTLGLGQLVKHALDVGCTEIVLVLGGSVSTDGGAGMLHALGAVLHSLRGRPLTLGINAIGNAAYLDLTGMDPRVANTTFTVVADVTNPLLGPHGAATAFGPSKGATHAQVVILERRLRRWSELVNAATGTDMTLTAGAGAAGGTGFAAMAVLGASFRHLAAPVNPIVFETP
jgi:glycerate 2-kinase